MDMKKKRKASGFWIFLLHLFVHLKCCEFGLWIKIVLIWIVNCKPNWESWIIEIMNWDVNGKSIIWNWIVNWDWNCGLWLWLGIVNWDALDFTAASSCFPGVALILRAAANQLRQHHHHRHHHHHNHHHHQLNNGMQTAPSQKLVALSDTYPCWMCLTHGLCRAICWRISYTRGGDTDN